MAATARKPGNGSRASDRLGRRGEDLAAEFLAASGLVVLDRNWRCRDGELDLVATDRSRLVVCEVKTRSGDGFGTPAEAVTAVKAARIRRLAAAWLAAHHIGWCEVRFDVLEVWCPPSGQATVEHLRGVL
ncbi:MAG: YraN family protein [Pseudonocardiaceae bacterium]